MLHNAKYKEHTKGPVIKDGLILKHSVVGTLDLFEKMERKGKKHVTAGSTVSFDKDNTGQKGDDNSHNTSFH